MASSLQQMAATISERSKTLINNDLKKILKEEGSPQTGNKAALQARVIGRTCFRSPFTSWRAWPPLYLLIHLHQSLPMPSQKTTPSNYGAYNIVSSTTEKRLRQPPAAP